MKNNALHHLEIDSGTIKIDGMKMKGVLSYTLKESARDLPELHLVIALPKKISLANKSTTCYNRRTKQKGDEEMTKQQCTKKEQQQSPRNKKEHIQCEACSAIMNSCDNYCGICGTRLKG